MSEATKGKIALEDLAKALVDQGVDLSSLATAGVDMKAPKKAAVPAPVKSGGNGKRKSKHQYGTSVVIASKGNLSPPDAARETQKRRLAQLESAIPGIGKAAVIFSVGKTPNGNLTRKFDLMANTPWTYVELPNGKDQTVGNLTANEVRSKLASCGYGFTRQKSPDGTPFAFWATASDGAPANRRMHGSKGNVAANMIDVED